MAVSSSVVTEPGVATGKSFLLVIVIVIVPAGSLTLPSSSVAVKSKESVPVILSLGK